MADQEKDKNQENPARQSIPPLNALPPIAPNIPGKGASPSQEEKTILLTPQDEKTLQGGPVPPLPPLPQSAPAVPPVPPLPPLPQSAPAVPPIPPLPPLPQSAPAVPPVPPRASSAGEKTIISPPPVAPQPLQPPQPPQVSAAEPPPLVLTDLSNQPHNRSGIGRVFLALLIVILVLAGMWYGVPIVLKKQSEKMAQKKQFAQAAQMLNYGLMIYPLDRADLLYLKGSYEKSAGQNAEAIQSLELAKVLLSNDVRLARALAPLYLSTGQKAKALVEAQSILVKNSSDAEALVLAAPLAFELGNSELAVQLGESLARSGLAQAEDLKRLGLSYLAIEKVAEATSTFKTALEKDPNLADVNYALGKIQFAANDFEAARDSFWEELAISSTNAEVQSLAAKAAQKVGEDLMRTKKWSSAIENFEGAVLWPSEFRGVFYYQLASLYALKRDKSKVLANLSLAVAEDPTLKKEAARDQTFRAYQRSRAFQSLVR